MYQRRLATLRGLTEPELDQGAKKLKIHFYGPL